MSPSVILVTKKDGGTCFFVDYWLNTITAKDAFPLPMIRDIQLHLNIVCVLQGQFSIHLYLSSNIPESPTYGVFVSQLIRYAQVFRNMKIFFELFTIFGTFNTFRFFLVFHLWHVWGIYV